MEGFTLSLALVDAIPVLCYGAGMLLVAARFQSPLFIAGAVLSTFAGCCKVIWKLILGIWNRNVQWLNRYFLPIQATGFALMLVSFVLGISRISWNGVLGAVTGMPAAVFFAAWVILMGVMVWFRRTHFNNTAKMNWIAQGINCCCQGALLLGILLAG